MEFAGSNLVEQRDVFAESHPESLLPRRYDEQPRKQIADLLKQNAKRIHLCIPSCLPCVLVIPLSVAKDRGGGLVTQFLYVQLGAVITQLEILFANQ